MSSINNISGVPGTSSSFQSSKTSSSKAAESLAEFRAQGDAVVIDASLGTTTGTSTGASSTGPDFQQLYQALSLTAREIVDKINEQIKVSLPAGVQSLKPEDVTPEATAERIVTGVTAFFDIYAKQHKNLQGEDLVNSFLSEVRKGVDKGYSEAFDILKSLGAFKFEGVQEGIEKTKSLIDQKLEVFGNEKKKELGTAPKAGEEASKSETPVLVTVA